ncbi:hypothetical protein AMTRI_Chr09g12630 [Amborella trichopoda]
MASSLSTMLAHLHHPSLVQALGSFTTMLELRQLHAHITTAGLSFDPFTISRLLALFAISNHGDIDHAQAIFAHFKNPTPFMYNSIIRGFSQSSEPVKAIQTFNQMLSSGIYPDNFTYPFVIRSCANLSHLQLGFELHAHIVKTGLDSDIFVQNNLINMYCCCDRTDVARRVFDEITTLDVVSWTTMITGYGNSGEIDAAKFLLDQMPLRNTVTYNAMITGYSRSGHFDEARKVFDEMPNRNVESWSTMISGYVHGGLFREALELFRKMLDHGFAPSESATVSALSACVQMRALDSGKWVHACIKEHKLKLNVIIGTALVDMYGKCGSIENALSVFEVMPMRNVISWNSMITSLALHGHGMHALSLFERMGAMGVKPNAITFVGVLSACSHSGLVKKGWFHFNSISKVYGIMPTVEHYGCMVDLLGRAGLLKEALRFIDCMPIKPHPGLWGALVGACKIHGDFKLGEEVGKRLIELEPHHSGRYVILSNIYASARKWDDVTSLRNLMRERGVLKTPGWSSVEANGEVHHFLVGDRNHPQAKEIHMALEEIVRKIRVAGYQPETKEVLFDLEGEESENVLNYHSEKIAIAFGFISLPPHDPIHVVKNLRICGDCHSATKFISKVFDREIIVRDRCRFHHFTNGTCSCSDYW